MWFRNIHFYRFEEPFTMSSQQLHEALETRQARACGQMEMACQGWQRPLGRAGRMLVHETDGNLMLCLRREDKVLPASLVREQVAEQAFQIEEQAGRTVGRREKSDIRDQVLQNLLPRALVRASHTYACIMPKDGWLVVNAGGSKKAEELIEQLRKTLGVLNVVLPATEESPESAMTRWLMNDAALPPGFTVEDECELQAGEGVEGVVRCKYVDVLSAEVRAHAIAGRRVKRMGMNWRDRLSFILHEDLSIRRMRFDSAIVEEAGGAGDDEASRFDADFAIMAAEIAEFIPELLAALNAGV
jgi:recombination associated protein RdgC